MSTTAYCYSASAPCARCGRSGDPHWVDMCEWSPTYGVCAVCLHPPRQPAPRARRTRAVARG